MNDKNKSTIDKLIMGAIIGAAVGSVIGASTAPEVGKKTRIKLKDKVMNFIKKFTNARNSEEKKG